MRTILRAFGSSTSVSDVGVRHTLGDGELLCRYLDGEQSAFAALVKRHGAMVMGVCLRLLRATGDADDAFQATFMVLARRARKLTQANSIAGWLHETARRASLKLRTASLRRRRLEDAAAQQHDDLLSTAEQPDRQAVARELADIVDAELARLPQRFREVLLLNQVHGLSRKEISDYLRIEPAAVKDRLERGRSLLANQLGRRGIKLSGAMLAGCLLPQSTTLCATVQASTVSAAAAFAAGVTAGPSVGAAAIAQGVLKMFALQKLKLTSLCLTSVLTVSAILTVVPGGSDASAKVQDAPRRFETGLRGEIVSVSAGGKPSITVRLDELDAMLNLDIAPDAKVWFAYEAGKLDGLGKGQYVSLQLASDHRTVTEMHVRGEQREVVVTSVGPNGQITAVQHDEDRDDDDDAPPAADAKPTTYQLADDAIVRIGGLPARPQELKPGMRIPLELAAGGAKVNAVEAEAPEGQLVRGTAAEVGVGTIKVKTDDDEDVPVVEVVLAVSAETKIVIGGQAKSLADIKPGSEVTVRVNDDRTQAQAISVDADNDEADDD